MKPGARGVVGAFATNSALNALLYTVYSSAAGPVAARFGVRIETVTLLFSIQMYTTAAASVFWILMIRRLPRFAQAVSVCGYVYSNSKLERIFLTSNFFQPTFRKTSSEKCDNFCCSMIV